MDKIRTIILTLVALVALGCSNGQSGYTDSYSHIAQITAFTMKWDSVPALAKTQFTVFDKLSTAQSLGYLQDIQLGDTMGVIFNKDSIAFGSSLDSVKLNFTFQSTPSSATIQIRYTDTTLHKDINKIIVASDTLNLGSNCKEVTIRVVSSDGTAKKSYRILPICHHVDPDKYEWTCVKEQIYADQSGDQQVIQMGDKALLFVANGECVKCWETATHTLAKGGEWQEKSTNLPAETDVRQIVCADGKLYYGTGEKIWTSEDGSTWTATTLTGKTILATLFRFVTPEGKECAWFYAKNATNDILCYYADGDLQTYKEVAVHSFPTSGYSSINFLTTSNRKRVMLLGGLSEEGKVLKHLWTLEWSEVTQNITLTDYGTEKLTYPQIVNASAVWYGDMMLLFGAQDGQYEYHDAQVYCSKDEGLHWAALDSKKCQLPERFGKRSKVAATVVDGTDIYLIGGKDNSKTYSDVYHGRLTSINWDK